MKTPYRLYYFPSCPYCVLVLRTAERLGIELELIDINRDPSARRSLLSRRGRATVPVLHDFSGEEPRLIPESRDIVRHLERIAGERRAVAG